MSRLRDLIEDGRVHVMDGAMGTLLYERGVFVSVCYDELSVTEPDRIRGVHEEYVAAGAEVLETNTFGANPVKLSAFGLEGRTEEINARAAALAREAARGRAAVAGAIGPLGVRIEPWGPTGRDEAIELFRRQADGLLEGGVDGFILETFADVEELRAALDAVRSVSDLPVIAQMTITDDRRTPYGTTADQIALELAGMKVDVVGLNCSVGPAAILDALEDMAEVFAGPLSAQPNAGVPRTVRDRKMYMASPEYMAQYARRMIEVGVRFVGGCCGTTPDHIRKIRDYVAAEQPRIAVSGVGPDVGAEGEGSVRPVALAARSRLGRKLANGEFVTSVELVPGEGWDPEPLLSAARQAHAAGLDAVGVLDRPQARSRMSVIPAASIVVREVGIEPIIHYTCRDRNMLGMISDLLGAAAVGIHNLLLSSGDPSAIGPWPDSTAVFDIDSIGLTNVAHRLNAGLDPGGNRIGSPTEFVVGVVAKPIPIDANRELERFAWKVEAGADFAITQPVFDPADLHAHLERTDRWPLPTVLGLEVLTSLRTAEFLEHEVPGVHVPASLLTRMRIAQDKGGDAAEREGVAIAAELLDRLRAHVAGVHLSAPAGRVDLALAVLEEAGISTA